MASNVGAEPRVRRDEYGLVAAQQEEATPSTSSRWQRFAVGSAAALLGLAVLKNSRPGSPLAAGSMHDATSLMLRSGNEGELESGLYRRASPPPGSAGGASSSLSRSVLGKTGSAEAWNPPWRTTTPGPKAEDTYKGFGSTPPPWPMPYRPGEYPDRYNISGSFPEDFVWGFGTSAYQIEGAFREDGRGVSIWDTFTGADTVGMPGGDCSYCCEEPPCHIAPQMWGQVWGNTGNVADDHYHMWQTDIALMKSMNLKHYRFSVAWPRIVPTGKVSEGVNQKGIDWYNQLIDALLEAGITPYVTLYHWDLPQALLSPPEMEGWYSRDANGVPNGQIQQHFVDFSDICFREFGDRVKFWITFNEPWTFLMLASGWGHAPSIPEYNDMTKDPYIGAHNVLVAHGAVVDLYRKKYQERQQGLIGMTLNHEWGEPKTDDPHDIAAAERASIFNLAWFSDPIFSGDYPPEMKKVVGDRLPTFTDEQKQLVNGSADFFGLNHYSTAYIQNSENENFDGSYSAGDHEGLLNGQSSWLYSAGWGFRKLLNWISRRHGNPPLWVTESGWSVESNTVEEGVHDRQRTEYYANYTSEMQKAIAEDGVDVRGFFAWSLMDNFEWSVGYSTRFGTIYVDYNLGEDPYAPQDKDNQPTAGRQVRTRKESNCWLEIISTRQTLVDPASPEFAGCVNSKVFAGNYLILREEVCTREVIVEYTGKTGRVESAGGGCTEAEKKIVPLKFSGGTIIADLSSSGGPDFLEGFWNNLTLTIEWGDGSKWEKVPSESFASAVETA